MSTSTRTANTGNINDTVKLSRTTGASTSMGHGNDSVAVANTIGSNVI